LEEYQQEPIPFSGNYIEGKYHRGPGPPYSIPPEPHPTGALPWKPGFDRQLGIYFWRNKYKKEEPDQYFPPDKILQELLQDVGERYPDTPPASESEEEELQEPEPEKEESPRPINIDLTEEPQEPSPNPLTLATDPSPSPIPALIETPIALTPASGPTQLTRQKTPDTDSSTGTPPALVVPLQVQVHPFTQLPLALSTCIPQLVLANISQFIQLRQQMAAVPAGVTMAQLRQQMNKLQGTKIHFTGKENPNDFKNKM